MKFEEFSIHANSNPNFKIIVDFICSEFSIETIVETGTYNGLGSTKIFCEAGLKCGATIQSIECCESNVLEARKNLEQFNNVDIIHGLSVSKQDAIEWMEQNLKIPPPEISMDYDLPPDLKHITTKQYLRLLLKSYTYEISEEVPIENVLPELIDNRVNQLIFLDSAGGIGFYEFIKCLMSIPKKFLKNKILMVDDVNRIKHYMTAEYLESEGYCVNYDKHHRLLWCKF